MTALLITTVETLCRLMLQCGCNVDANKVCDKHVGVAPGCIAACGCAPVDPPYKALPLRALRFFVALPGAVSSPATSSSMSWSMKLSMPSSPSPESICADLDATFQLYGDVSDFCVADKHCRVGQP